MKAAQMLEDDSGEIPMTTWYNPLDTEQRVFLWMDGTRRKIVWKPKERKSLPSSYDRMIQVVHGNTIIGGQAPALVREVPGQDPPLLHQDLDVEFQAQKQKAADAAAATVAAVTREIVRTADEPKPVKK